MNNTLKTCAADVALSGFAHLSTRASLWHSIQKGFMRQNNESGLSELI